MDLRPLGDRVLIAPESAPTQTASGLHLAEDWKPEQTGTVVAVGQARHPRQDEAFAMAALLEHYQDDTGRVAELLDVVPEDAACVGKAAQLLRDLTGRVPAVHVGDFVIFSWQVGQEVWVEDGQARYLLMREADILAVVDPDGEGSRP